MSNFDSLIGQETAKKLLGSALKNNRIAHAYLFTGPANLGKFKFAVEFAKILQGYDKNKGAKDYKDKISAIESGTDPDVMIIDPSKSEEGAQEEESISVEKVRALEHHLSLFPYNSKYKIAIINSAHRFTDEAGNAFLKTLEEPRGNSVIILIAESKHLLPATVVSRAETIRFWPVKEKMIEDSLVAKGFSCADAAKAASFSQGKPGLAICLAENTEKLSDYDQELEKFNDFIKGKLEDRFLFAEKMAKGEEQIQSTLRLWTAFMRKMILEKYLEDGKTKTGIEQLLRLARGLNVTINLINTSNVNKKLALENLALEI